MNKTEFLVFQPKTLSVSALFTLLNQTHFALKKIPRTAKTLKGHNRFVVYVCLSITFSCVRCILWTVWRWRVRSNWPYVEVLFFCLAGEGERKAGCIKYCQRCPYFVKIGYVQQLYCILETNLLPKTSSVYSFLFLDWLFDKDILPRFILYRGGVKCGHNNLGTVSHKLIFNTQIIYRKAD